MRLSNELKYVNSVLKYSKIQDKKLKKLLELSNVPTQNLNGTLQKKWHVCWKSFKAIGFGQSSSSTYRQMELVHEELFTNMDSTEAST